MPFLVRIIVGLNTLRKLKATGSLLKSMEIWELLMDVVEGGKEAFQKREGNMF